MHPMSVRINGTNQLVLSKSLVIQLGLSPSYLEPFYVELLPKFNEYGDAFKFHLKNPIDVFTGLWFNTYINGNGISQTKSNQGEALKNLFSFSGYQAKTKYEVVDVIRRDSFVVIKKEL